VQINRIQTNVLSATQPVAGNSSMSPPTPNTDIYTFLATLRGRDIHVSIDGDRLRCNAPPGALTAELRDELQRRKSEILNFLRSATALAHQQRAIVPLQSQGSCTPVFAVAGHNGDIFCYRSLARHLGDDQPFFGLQPPGLDGQSTPLTRVEDLATYFASEIRAFRPNGPYIIVGYCAGGTIAFELARQLLRDGAAIDFLALFGSPFPTWYRRLSQLRWQFGRQVKRVATHTRTVISLSSTERRSYVAERLRNRKALRTSALAATPDPVLVQRERLGAATVAAIRRYAPGHFAGRLNLFLPTQWLCPDEVLVQWRSVVEYAEGHFGPDGCTGDSMLREPYASAFANLFRRYCQGTAPSDEEERLDANAEPPPSHVELASG
jgi:thioesterase domain-containing protein